MRLANAPASNMELRLTRFAMLAFACMVLVMFARIASALDRIEKGVAGVGPARIAELQAEIVRLKARTAELEAR